MIEELYNSVPRLEESGVSKKVDFQLENEFESRNLYQAFFSTLLHYGVAFFIHNLFLISQKKMAASQQRLPIW